VKLPDRFKKEIEAEKIEKFKAKPGLQRAFQTIRKIEPKKWQDTRDIRREIGEDRVSDRKKKPLSCRQCPGKKPSNFVKALP